MLNDTLRLIRSFHDLNKSEAATKLGISRSYISEIESGQKRVTLDLLEKYSSTFNIPMSSLLLFDEKKRDGSLKEDVRVAIGGKVVQMMNWLASITETEDERNEAKVTQASST